MARPTELQLGAASQQWRSVPMTGANMGVEVVPLASFGDTFAILCKFPAGFQRTTAGGYVVAEEFILLSGELQLEEVVFQPGQLAFVPAHYLRTNMTSPDGALALAWFGGPAIFRAPEELSNAAISGEIPSTMIHSMTVSDPFHTSEASWYIRQFSGNEDLVMQSDLIDVGLNIWRHVTTEQEPLELVGTFLQRVPGGQH